MIFLRPVVQRLFSAYRRARRARPTYEESEALKDLPPFCPECWQYADDTPCGDLHRNLAVYWQEHGPRVGVRRFVDGGYMFYTIRKLPT